MGTEKKAGDLEEIQVLEGISESEEIDRRVEELMAPEEEGNGKKKKKKKHKTYEGRKIASFTDLSIGDYVVHENHGLGIYRGIEKIEVDHTIKDYMKIEYSKGSYLYILATQLDVIQ